jgi:hypothetical protein
MTAGDLLSLDRRSLRGLLADGYPVDPDAIAGWQYRGVSLGLPAWVDRLAWKTFVKAFHRDPGARDVRGWNVRIEQTGLGGPIVPRVRGGGPMTFGHFRVVDPAGYRMPAHADRGLLLDYGLGGNASLDPTSRVRDPIVALAAGSADLLLGWTYLDLGALRLGTPSFFSLERAAPVEEVASPPRTGRA